MAERISGIKGYVGELVLGEWLKNKFGKDNIRSQVRSINVRAAGGPYLDFCVIEGNNVTEVYEIKTQEYDYPPINSSLKYLWGLEKGIDGKFFKHSKNKEAILQEDKERELFFSDRLKAYLVLMKKPAKGYEKDESIPKGSILFLKELLGDLLRGSKLGRLKKTLIGHFKNDAAELIDRILKD
jgi:hypothetical protein